MMYGKNGQVDYEWIKRQAKATGMSVNDYIVLAPQNDPFYTGTPNDRALGEWFAQVWRQLGEERAHIRRVHYYLVSVGVAFPNGKPYENTVECWDTLNTASKAARYLQLVDPAAFNDRRTPEAMLYASDDRPEQASVSVYSPVYSLGMRLPDFPHLPMYELGGFQSVQPYHLEVWCEKSTMNDVLGPLCQRYGANLQTGMGEMSITATLALVQRLQQANKPARILYVSDFDPAGMSMPVAVGRKMEYFIRTLGIGLDVKLFPVVLTLEQVQYYQLPRTPIKETERRRAGFEELHGSGAVELDALEALYPGTLDEILSRYLDAYYDWSLEDRVRDQRNALQAEMSDIWQQVMVDYQEEVDTLKQEYQTIKEAFEPRMQEVSNQLRNLWQAVKRDMERYTSVAQSYPVPLPALGEEIGDGLYSSDRDYLDQVETYKRFQGRL